MVFQAAFFRLYQYSNSIRNKCQMMKVDEFYPHHYLTKIIKKQLIYIWISHKLIAQFRAMQRISNQIVGEISFLFFFFLQEIIGGSNQLIREHNYVLCIRQHVRLQTHISTQKKILILIIIMKTKVSYSNHSTISYTCSMKQLVWKPTGLYTENRHTSLAPSLYFFAWRRCNSDKKMLNMT